MRKHQILLYYLQMITPLPQKFEPGTRFGYSNARFVMLGLVIEAISGTTYQQFIMPLAAILVLTFSLCIFQNTKL